MKILLSQLFLWLAAGSIVLADDNVPSTSPGFSLIPAGAFMMGSSARDGGKEDERPLREVTVSAFYMAQHEITKALWDEVRAWGASHGYADLPVGGGKASDHPVEKVTWFDEVS